MRSFDQTVKNFMWGDLTAGMFEAADRGARWRCCSTATATSPKAPASTSSRSRDGRLMTPDTGVLHGITRRTAIELAQGSTSRPASPRSAWKP
jgi:branched-chain amino acid aminotransferase